MTSERVNGWLSSFYHNLVRHPNLYLLPLGSIYLVTTLIRATAPLWYDELFTLYIARMPTISAGWQLVKNGMDLNPPLIYAAAHVSGKLFGTGEVSTRLPSILAFLAALLCLFRFLRRRVGVVFGLCGVMIPLLSGAYAYSFEARPYSLVIGGSALALWSWQMAAENRRRFLALIGISVGLGIALLSHCYAVALVLPFALGEGVRSLTRRRVDWLVWAAFSAAAPAVLFYPALIRHSLGSAGHIPMYIPTLWAIPGSYLSLLKPALVWLLPSALLICLRSKASSRALRTREVFPNHEFAALVGFTLIPAVLVAVTMIRSSIFSFRYGLAAILGLSGILTGFLYSRLGGKERLGAVALLLLAGGFVANFGIDAGALFRQMASRPRAGVYGQPLLSGALNTNLPLVIANGLLFLPVDYYSPPDLAGRTYFLVDARAAIHFTGSDVFDAGYPSIARAFPLRAHVTDYGEFIAVHDHFLVYCDQSRTLNWLTSQLGADHYSSAVIVRSGNIVLSDVNKKSVNSNSVR